jgi:hypothetical protein
MKNWGGQYPRHNQHCRQTASGNIASCFKTNLQRFLKQIHDLKIVHIQLTTIMALSLSNGFGTRNVE